MIIPNHWKGLLLLAFSLIHFSAFGQTVSNTTGPRLESEFKETLEDSSTVLDQNIGAHSSGGFTPHYNPVTGKTMWTSPDGRSSYVTIETVVSTKLRP